MNILLIGSGGRECALAWKIAQSPLTENLYILPGNAGTGEYGVNVEGINASDHESVVNFAQRHGVDIVVVGPEEPLVNGLADALSAANIKTIGPKSKGATLEGSKQFAKEFMIRHHIPTARYESFTTTNVDKADAFLESLRPPYVLKADGLAAGKGVLILNDLNEAKSQLRAMLSGMFGKAGNTVVIEEYLSGIEMSVFVLTDGKGGYVILPEAKDYKRIGDNDEGPNTGGMGAVSPVPFADKQFMQKVEERIIRPTINGLQADGIDYCGFIFFGLMNTDGEPYVIEYNVRMGDPETEVVMPRIESDFVELLDAATTGTLAQKQIKISADTCTTVVMVSEGYPGKYSKGVRMQLPANKDLTGIRIFHAGTATDENGQTISAGGRVLAVSGRGRTKDEAIANSYRGVGMVSFPHSFYRRDISKDLDKYYK